jgi:hypothetical protein
MGSLKRELKRKQERKGGERIRVKSVIAEEFGLADKKGNVRALLMPTDSGGVTLAFRDENNTTRLSVGILPGGAPGLCLFDEHRIMRLTVALGENNAPVVGFYNDKGIQQFALAWTSKEEWGILVCDDEGRGPRWATITREQAAPEARAGTTPGDGQNQE